VGTWKQGDGIGGIDGDDDFLLQTCSKRWLLIFYSTALHPVLKLKQVDVSSLGSTIRRILQYRSSFLSSTVGDGCNKSKTPGGRLHAAASSTHKNESSPGHSS
jgi:hypothetical protein